MAGQFTLDLSRIIEKAKGRIELVHRKICLDLFTKVVMQSPVGNPTLWKNPPPPGYVGGRFRGNWQAFASGYGRDTTPRIDPSGGATINEIASRVAGFKTGGVVHLVNNLPYSIRLEYGWSTQAPAGMVRAAVAAYPGVVLKAAR